MTLLRLAAIQMNSGDEMAINLRRASRYLAAAARDGAQLAVLPENFGFMGAQEAERVALAESDGSGPLQDFLAESAARYGLWIVGGTLPLRGARRGRPHAACLVYDSSGRRVARYDKLHLFDVRVPDSGEAYRESRSTTPGAAALLVKTPWAQMGVAVCYDLRFPEQFRHLAAQGMELLVVPAAFTRRTGAAHWEVLLRARAIENLCYVAAAAQTGTHPGGRQTWGHAMVVDPWGTIMAAAATRPGVVMATIDSKQLERLRQQFPVLEHRRADTGF